MRTIRSSYKPQVRGALAGRERVVRASACAIALIGAISLAFSTPAWAQAEPLTITGANILGCTNDTSTGNIGSAFTQRIYATGGNPGAGTYYWYPTPGTSLPSGLALGLDQNRLPTLGVIEGDGTPSDMPPPGDYPFSLRVSDRPLGTPGANFVQGPFNLHVGPDSASIACTPDIWTLTQFPAQPPNLIGMAIADRPFTATLPILGGRAPWTMQITSGSLPKGLLFNTLTGAVYGEISSLDHVGPGPYPFTVQITDCVPATSSTPCGPGPQLTKTVSNTFEVIVCGVGDANYPCPQSPSRTHDFNGDHFSDLLFQVFNGPGSGSLAIWLADGSQILQSAGIGSVAGTWSAVGQRDFNGDGKADILWRDSGGNIALWLMNGLQLTSGSSLGNVPVNWTIDGTADLFASGSGDILWRDSTTGAVALWIMSGGQVIASGGLGVVPNNWSLVGDDDNGNIFWRDTAGDLGVWPLGNGNPAVGLGNVATNWTIAALGDFNGDGVTDILWRDRNSGTLAIWFLNSALQVEFTANLGAVSNVWSVAQSGDYNGDGVSDILWVDNAGNLAIWFMTNVGTVSSAAAFGNIAGWSVQSANAE